MEILNVVHDDLFTVGMCSFLSSGCFTGTYRRRTLKLLKLFVLNSPPAKNIWFAGTEFDADSNVDGISNQCVGRTLNHFLFETKYRGKILPPYIGDMK